MEWMSGACAGRNGTDFAPTMFHVKRRRGKLQIARFRASAKARSFRCLAPVAAERLPGQSGPPIAPLLFSGSLHPPLAALRRKTPLPTEPASLGFGGGPIVVVTGAAAPRAARIGVTLQALGVVSLCRPGPPGRRRYHATEIPGWSQ